MQENMSISVNGQSQVPPGFRFHPTEEELLQYYLKKKISYEQIDLDVIRDVDLNKLEPWDIQEKCKIGSTPQNDWYFFSHKDKKYPTGTRTNRATAAGFWKATGRDKVIYSNSSRIGMRKTLVFYKGRAPHGQKSDWIMHEYRLDDIITDTNIVVSNATGEATQEEGWVVCRIFKKKIHLKTLDSPMSSSITAEARTQTMSSSEEGALEHILQYMGRSCEEEDEGDNSKRFLGPIDTAAFNNTLHVHHDRFMKLPSLESPNSLSTGYQQVHVQMVTDNDSTIVNQVSVEPNNSVYHSETDIYNWAALDRFVASRLNGQTETSKQLACFNIEPNPTTMPFSSPCDHDHLQLQQLLSSSSSPNRRYQDYNNEFDLRSFARSSMSSLDHTPNVPHV